MLLATLCGQGLHMDFGRSQHWHGMRQIRGESEVLTNLEEDGGQGGIWREVQDTGRKQNCVEGLVPFLACQKVPGAHVGFMHSFRCFCELWCGAPCPRNVKGGDYLLCSRKNGGVVREARARCAHTLGKTIRVGVQHIACTTGFVA